MASTAVPGNAGIGERLTCGGDERVHVVGVALGGVVGIVLAAVQRVLGGARSDAAARAIDNGDPDAERSEIDACNDCHIELSIYLCQCMSQPRYFVLAS